MQNIKNAKERLKVLEHAKKIENVKKTCETFDISRTTFYSWKSRYEEIGLKGLYDKTRSKITKKNDNKRIMITHYKEKPLIKNDNNSNQNNSGVFRILNNYKIS